MKFPKHDCSLHLDHNPHKAYYFTVQESIEVGDFGFDSFISEEEKQDAINNNDVWIIQWYPDTPIGFYVAAAYSLDNLLKHVQKEGEYE